MSAVIHKFNVPLTDEQFRRIRKEWTAHGKRGCAVICQPVGVNGLLTFAEPYFTCGILTEGCSKEIDAVLKKHAFPRRRVRTNPEASP